jgi:hypothetical protein
VLLVTMVVVMVEVPKRAPDVYPDRVPDTRIMAMPPETGEKLQVVGAHGIRLLA